MDNEMTSAMGTSALVKPKRHSWSGSAFILESLLLIVFFIASFAIILQLLTASYIKGQEASELTTAVSLATLEAERFAEDPAADASPKQYSLAQQEIGDGDSLAAEDAFVVKREVTLDEGDAGTLYKAHITVERGDHEVYALDTAKYVSTDPARMSSTATSSKGVQR